MSKNRDSGLPGEGRTGGLRTLLRWFLRACAVVVGVIVLVLLYMVQPVPGTSSRQTAPSVHLPRLEQHVAMLSEQFIPRDATHPDNLDRVARYIRDQFSLTRGSVTEQPYEAGGKTYRNVMVTFGPKTTSRIVVGAHYDAARLFPGADDNASGVAGLIELACLVDTLPLSIAVELVAYSLEEPPFFRTDRMGSAVHAEALKREGVDVRAMVCLEMIGYFSDDPESQHYPSPLFRLLYPSRGNFIFVVGLFGQASLVRTVKAAMAQASPLEVYSINAPRFLRGIDFSDHLNYWEAGFPAVMITDLAFYRNPNYHTALDTRQRLDFRRMSYVVQGVAGALQRLAEEHAQR